MVGVVCVPVLANVVKLLENHRAFLVNGLGDLPEVRDHLIRAVPEVTPCQHRRRMHRNRLDHQHSGTAQGAFTVVGHMSLGGQTLLRHVRGVRPKHNAVAQGLVPQRHGGKNVGIWI